MKTYYCFKQNLPAILNLEPWVRVVKLKRGYFMLHLYPDQVAKIERQYQGLIWEKR